MLLAIDSGKNLGWALFLPTGQLHSCGLRTLPSELPALTRIIIERPHAGRTRARARDILTLAIRAGEAGGVLRYLTGVEPEYIEPQRWKGQLPKKRCNAIVEAKLSEQEKRLLNNIKPVSAKHNVLDAIGIGLFSVGR
jgi:hypothetical protein